MYFVFVSSVYYVSLPASSKMGCSDDIMNSMASQLTSVSFVYSTVCSGAYQRKHQRSAPLSFVRVKSPVTGELPAQRASNAENVSL